MHRVPRLIDVEVAPRLAQIDGRRRGIDLHDQSHLGHGQRGRGEWLRGRRAEPRYPVEIRNDEIWVTPQRA